MGLSEGARLQIVRASRLDPGGGILFYRTVDSWSESAGYVVSSSDYISAYRYIRTVKSAPDLGRVHMPVQQS
ncbi:hypothetical protein P8C59_008861 [Phyllachora maydis]|uniref:Uncharacterized protein n=1 Tax=Phyllachora maydis TaxID=1825666 RepID=A0AAD9MIZ5_9PEZI|nr:hypothetical protein P8C59_008861 [Phyllachora maydis]